jgi:cyanophycinase
MMIRRKFLGKISSLIAVTASGVLPTWAQMPKVSRLVIVGGAEDRLQDRIILRKFSEYCGGPQARIRIITAASADPQGVWQSYREAFHALGVRNVDRLAIDDRESAQAPAVQAEILEADGIFMSGGDQSKLMGTLWDTAAYESLHQAFHMNRCCIGGTSAGAAVMSRHMIAQGPSVLRPSKEAVDTDIGLGLLSQAVVDQHFSERRRLPRLLSTLAMRPDLLGVGIDEDTALVIERGVGIEVIGQGTVTLVDPSQMQSNVDDLEVLDQIEMLGVQLHLLPAGHRYTVKSVGQGARSAPLRRAIQRLVAVGPIRG